jgi:hypothetical protein
VAKAQNLGNSTPLPDIVVAANSAAGAMSENGAAG